MNSSGCSKWVAVCLYVQKCRQLFVSGEGTVDYCLCVLRCWVEHVVFTFFITEQI